MERERGESTDDCVSSRTFWTVITSLSTAFGMIILYVINQSWDAKERVLQFHPDEMGRLEERIRRECGLNLERLGDQVRRVEEDMKHCQERMRGKK